MPYTTHHPLVGEISLCWRSLEVGKRLFYSSAIVELHISFIFSDVVFTMLRWTHTVMIEDKYKCIYLQKDLFKQEELKSVEDVQPASICCKEYVWLLCCIV